MVFQHFRQTLLFGLTFIFINSQAQTSFSWGTNLAGKKADRINELRISASDETFITGFFIDSMTLESDKLYGGYYQSFVAKYDNSGNKLWAHDIGGVGFDYGWAMTTDASDNVYAGVVFNGVVDITRIIEPHQLTSLCENHAGIRNGNRPKMGQYC